jgi:hypothetical protein
MTKQVLIHFDEPLYNSMINILDGRTISSYIRNLVKKEIEFEKTIRGEHDNLKRNGD